MFQAEEKLALIRSIIDIKPESCTGCGLCVMDCPRGALTIEDGRAALIHEKLCLGDGKCLNSCPSAALRLVRRRAEPFDIKEYYTSEEESGESVSNYARLFAPFMQHSDIPTPLATPGEDESLPEAAAPYPGPLPCESSSQTVATTHTMLEPLRTQARRQNWPLKLSLINSIPQNADVLLCADCAPARIRNFQEAYADNRQLITICPILEETGLLASKLAGLLAQSRPRSLTTLRMDTECCNGAHLIGTGAVNMSGAGVMPREIVIGQDGREIS